MRYSVELHVIVYNFHWLVLLVIDPVISSISPDFILNFWEIELVVATDAWGLQTVYPNSSLDQHLIARQQVTQEHWYSVKRRSKSSHSTKRDWLEGFDMRGSSLIDSSRNITSKQGHSQCKHVIFFCSTCPRTRKSGSQIWARPRKSMTSRRLMKTAVEEPRFSPTIGVQILWLTLQRAS